MADEFNPQGVDQTPRNNENPNSTADTGNAEPKNPFVGGDSVDAGNASDSSEQQAPVPPAAPAADSGLRKPLPTPPPPSPSRTTPPPRAEYGGLLLAGFSGSAGRRPDLGHNSAVSSGPGIWRLWSDPDSGTGPAGRPGRQQCPAHAAIPVRSACTANPTGQQGNRNPYYTNNPQPQGNGNPFNPPTQPQQNNGNPFASQSGQNGQNGQQPQQGGLFGFGTPGTGTPNGQGPTQPGQPGQPGPAKQGMSKTASNILIAVVAAVLAAALCLGLGYGALTSGLITLPTSNSLSNVSSNKSGSGSATAKSGEAPDWQTVASDVSGSVVSIQTALSNGTAKLRRHHRHRRPHHHQQPRDLRRPADSGDACQRQHVFRHARRHRHHHRSCGHQARQPAERPQGREIRRFRQARRRRERDGHRNPLGYDDTATTGIRLRLNRPVTVTDDNNNEIVTNAVQIDAAINPATPAARPSTRPAR